MPRMLSAAFANLCESVRFAMFIPWPLDLENSPENRPCPTLRQGSWRQKLIELARRESRPTVSTMEPWSYSHETLRHQGHTALAEQGSWVDSIRDLPGIWIKARGANNSDYRLLEAALIREIPRADRLEGLKPADQDRIMGTLLLETVVIDVEGLTEDDGKTPVAYSRELGQQLLLDLVFRVFCAGAAYAGAIVADRRAADQEIEVKN